jgi:hypothetical protein
MRPRQYDISKLPEAVVGSKSYKDVARYLGKGSIGSIKRQIKNQNLNISHFNSQESRTIEMKKLGKIYKESEIFVINPTASLATVKRFFRAVTKYKCVSCDNEGFYNGLSLILQMDHKNGNKKDCRKKNLRWLCPNCHCQTSTWGNKKIDSKPRPCDSKRIYI